jgi:GT2 family glycosyltransferase
LATYRVDRSAEWLVGAFLIARSAAIQEVGLLDEDFFMYSEEKDWCRRFHAAGWDVRHLPVMSIIHHTGRSSRPDLIAQRTSSKLLYASKHIGRLRRTVLRAALVINHVFRFPIFAALATLSTRHRTRMAAEGRALLVALGVQPPPFAPGGVAREKGRASP